MMDEIAFDPIANLEKIKRLTNTVVPFAETVSTIDHTLTFDLLQGSGFGVGVFKTREVGIMISYVDPDSIHQSHFHNEKEILILIEGCAEVLIEHSVILLEKGGSITILPGQAHEIHFITKSEMISITIPASEDYPNGIRHK